MGVVLIRELVPSQWLVIAAGRGQLAACGGHEEEGSLVRGILAELLQWCPALSNPMDYSQPGSSVHGILQARILAEIHYLLLLLLSHFSCVQLYATLWTIASQAPLSVGFSRHEYWSG